jgi:hypothetical protein
MSFTNFVPPLLTPEQSGAMPDILSKILSGYSQATNARYLKPSLEEALKKAQLGNVHAQQQNQYYAPDMESQMALRKAQIGQAQANAQKARLIQQAQQIMMGDGDNQEQTNQPSPLSGNSQLNPYIQSAVTGAPSFDKGQRDLSPEQLQWFSKVMPPPRTGQQSNEQNALSPEQTQRLAQAMPEANRGQVNQGQNPNYGQVATAMQILGMGKPQVVQDASGKYVAITPRGGIDTGVSTLSEGEKAFQGGLGKYKANYYGKSVDAYNGYSNQNVALQQLKGAIENNPDFRKVVGPIRKPITEWLGTPEQKNLLGTVQSTSGVITLQVAPALKGTFSSRDQTLIDSIKASPKDWPDVFIGKLQAQMTINNVLRQRSKLQSEMIEHGMSPIQASEHAAKATPLSAYKPMIDKLTKPSRSAPPKMPTLEEIRAEKARRQAQGLNNG